MIDVRPAVDWEHGLIRNQVFIDEEVYQQELERIFRRCWLFVGHESSIPEIGDYVTNFMGTDQVIVLRDPKGKLRVFLNKCLHRGNKVCFYDRGNARTFTCTFHGWQYNTEGKIVGVPYFEDGYLGELDRNSWGLVEVPRVATYGGLIFACWDAGAMPLDDYLGDVRWYFDRLLVRDYLGGMEVVGGIQRYDMPSNWKLLSDNFAGDDYHVPTTHASYFKVLAEDARKYRANFDLDETVTVALGYGTGVPHGIGSIGLGAAQAQQQRDLDQAQGLGPEAVDWVRDRYARIAEFMKDDPIRVWKFANANVFPNFCIISTSSAFQAQGLILWQPRAPLLTECWQWCAVERDAPKVVKQLAIRNLMKGQAAAGLIATDDSENFERSTDNLMGHAATEQPFNYAMAVGHDRDHAFRDKLRGKGLDVDLLPGLVGPHIWEAQQRQFYRYWETLMSSQD
ncbi:MAG TPA: Rieske 2Fe-2S domain-containing protein [Chloroflexota bacterium]|nr:Rieske 2Fe-2S domain-containing protein [Chloroflexota bacterium]